MFKRLNIKNFKSYEGASISFHKGVNVFLGSPQDGKTNILRAIRLVSQNRPLAFRKSISNFLKNKDKKSIEINLELDDVEVTLEKHKKTANSKYYLETDEGIKSFSAGRTVPDQVKDFINLSDLNFQPQLDMPYLITSSPGQIAKTINKITDLDKSDEWVDDLTKKINNKSKRISFIEGEIEKKEKELKKYNGIEKLEKDLIKIEKLERKINRLETFETEVYELLEKIDEKESRIIDAKALKNMAETLQLAGDTLKKLNDMKLYMSNLESVISSISEAEESLEDNEEAKEKEKRALVKIMKKFNMCPFCFGKIGKKEMTRIVKQVEEL